MFETISAISIVESLIGGGIIETAKAGITKFTEKSPKDRMEKALDKALNKVSRGNEIWKNNVLRQKEDVISILFQIMYDGKYLEKNTLPSYLDEETINCFKECLKEDKEVWNFLNKQLDRRILLEIKGDSKETHDLVREIAIKMGIISAYIAKHFLTQSPPKANASNVIGREADLQTLWNALCQKQHVMLTGFGGIGKTKLAQMLFHAYEGEFDEVAWVDYQGNAMKSFMVSFNAPQFQGDYKNEEDWWKAMNSILNNDDKKKLFIIDNVDNKTDEQLQALTGWRETTILLTSRLPELEGYEEHSLGSLSEEDCIALFNHYLKKRTATREQAARFAELAYQHTLTIELLAKGALQKKDLDAYYNEVKDGFDMVDMVEHHNVEDTIEHHLHALYDMQKRKPKEKEVLNALAVLPEKCECERKELEDWFDFKESDWHDLMRDGWLAFDATSQMYSLHPVVRTIVRFDFSDNGQNSKTIAPGDVADRLLEYCAKHEWYDTAQSLQSLLRRSEILDSALVASSQKEIEGASLLNNIKSCRYDVTVLTEAMNYYNEATNYLCKAMETMKKKLDTEHPSSDITNNNIDGFYDYQSYYNKASEYYEKANEIFDTKFPNTDRTYNNDSLFYDLRDAKKSVEYFLKKLEFLMESFKT